MNFGLVIFFNWFCRITCTQDYWYWTKNM